MDRLYFTEHFRLPPGIKKQNKKPNKKKQTKQTQRLGRLAAILNNQSMLVNHKFSISIISISLLYLVQVIFK